jgi:predicted tellurium resistance membrane protein TerC
MIKLIDYLQQRMKIVIGACYVLLTLIATFAAIVDKSHAHTWVEQHIPLYWSLFGFVAASVIIGIAYWYGHSGIQARTNYYDCPLKRDCTSSDS